jgi:hypothetical protein
MERAGGVIEVRRAEGKEDDVGVPDLYRGAHPAANCTVGCGRRCGLAARRAPADLLDWKALPAATNCVNQGQHELGLQFC